MKIKNNLHNILLSIIVLLLVGVLIFFAKIYSLQKQNNEMFAKKLEEIQETLVREKESEKEESRIKHIYSTERVNEKGIVKKGVVSIFNNDSTFTDVDCCCIKKTAKTKTKKRPKISDSLTKKVDTVLENQEEMKKILEEINDKIPQDPIEEKVLDDTITATATLQKINPDSSWVLFQRSMAFGGTGFEPINYKHTFTEYLPNTYRKKKENSFKLGIGLGILSGGFYALSESVKNPIFIEGEDNSDAQKRSDKIKYLRLASAITGIGSAFQFTRTIHFHNLEGKFIVNPTSIGLKINLNK